MTDGAKKLISDGMKALGLNYAFIEWKDRPAYPYFTGEYKEQPVISEDGLQETDFILNGFSRGSHSDLEAAKQKIEKYFYKEGRTAIAPSGNAVAVCYNNSLVIHTGDAELKRIEIHLNVKEWKVS